MTFLEIIINNCPLAFIVLPSTIAAQGENLSAPVPLKVTPFIHCLQWSSDFLNFGLQLYIFFFNIPLCVEATVLYYRLCLPQAPLKVS